MPNQSISNSVHLQFGSDAGVAKICQQAQQMTSQSNRTNLILSQAEPRIDEDSYLTDLLHTQDDA